MDNLSRDLDRARGKRNALAFKRDALASDVTTLTVQIAELEARLSDEKDRRERERIGGEIEGIKKRLKDTSVTEAPELPKKNDRLLLLPAWLRRNKEAGKKESAEDRLSTAA